MHDESTREPLTFSPAYHRFASELPVIPTSPQEPPVAPSYYDVPMLKEPTWGTEVAAYFYPGGMSAGAYLVARMAECFGGDRYRDVTPNGTALAVLAIVPCAPLLIADLGDWNRFHHMLRVFKPSSPMNLGAWTLMAYTGATFAAGLREPDRNEEYSLASDIVDDVLLAVSDLAGIPLALLLAGYTGVLLSGTSTPLWCKNPWLGALFSAGALANGAGAISLVASVRENEDATEAVSKIDTVAHVAEVVTAAGFLASVGGLAEPLLRGEAAPAFWGAALSVVGAEVIKILPLPKRLRPAADLAAAVLGLVGGFALRWSVVRAGRASAADPEAARRATRPHTPRGTIDPILLLAEQGAELVQARLGAVLAAEPDGAAALQVADDHAVLMPLGDGALVNAHDPRGRVAGLPA